MDQDAFEESGEEGSTSAAGKKSFVSDVAWVKRGVPKAVPEKVEIAREELRQLIQDHIDETSEDDTEVAEMDDGPEKGGLRGSAPQVVDNSEGIGKYRLEEYDQDTAGHGPSMKGIACYTSPQDDPQITRHQDSDEEEERDDFELKPGDNLLVVAKFVREEEASLEVYVYNEERGDWYVHHDYLLDAPPLCLAAFTYDPGADDHRGNLLAVGTMDSVVNVWDLDIVNAVKPVLTLGRSSLKPSSKRRHKRDGTAQGHSDGVLCLDWNRTAEHVMASGSADQSLILWDLDEAKASTVVNFDSMVQSCQWHPSEQSVILTGTRGSEIAIVDCRMSEPHTLKWTLGEEVEMEKVAWQHSNSAYFLAVSDDGMLRYADRRKPGAFVAEVLAHEGGASGMSQSYLADGLVVTAGSKELKAWKLNECAFELLCTHPVRMGEMNVISFCPDSAYVLVVGAQTEEMVRLIDLGKHTEVVHAFADKEQQEIH